MTIPDEAVEVAARALWELRASASYPEWPNVDLGLREEYRKDARAALTAAAPCLRAQVVTAEQVRDHMDAYEDLDGQCVSVDVLRAAGIEIAARLVAEGTEA